MVTPIQKADNLAKFLGLSELYLKREDLHPLGSHKGRSIPLMLDHHRQSGARSFVISSSGNAALAAALTVKEINQANPESLTTLRIFVGLHIPAEKLKRLTDLSDTNITVFQVEKPKHSAKEETKTSGTIWLRQSTDDTALVGYEALAKEILDGVPLVQTIFVPTSSGTTAVGLGTAFNKLNTPVAIHVVQTTACHPFVEDTRQTENSLAGAIVDKVGHRKIAVQNIIKTTGGSGWVAEDTDIESAVSELKKYEALDASPNSALALVGLKLATASGITFSGPVVLLITGR